MGEVYRAQNVSLGRKVAIKLLNKEHTSNEDDVMRFLREARAAAAVRHPNVVDVFDVARDDDGTPFIVQELLSGQDLEQHLNASGGLLGPDEALEIMIPVADAVATAHARDVVHRDLKPANIFLAREGNKVIPKVLDFGACLYQTVGALSAKEQRMLIGTPHYMAPEQITTAMDVDVRADVWAMGVIIYELLVGETPFEADDASTVLKLVRTRQVLPLRRKAPRASERLEELVAQCLDRDRKKRVANAGAVREELEAIRADLRVARSARELGGTPPVPPEKVDVHESRIDESRIRDRRNEDPRRDEEDLTSSRVPSLVLKGGNSKAKRRGSSLLALSNPDEPVAWEPAPPHSASWLNEPGKAAGASLGDSRSGATPARTAADVIREAEAAPRPVVAPPPAGAPASSRTPSLDMSPFSSPLPPIPSLQASPSPASVSSPAPSPAPHASRSREHGAPRDFDFDDLNDPVLDLDLAPSTSRSTSEASVSSLPPVLDPRAASSKARSDGPPPASTPVAPPAREPALEGLRSSQITARDPALAQALTPPLHASRTPSTAQLPERAPAWTTNSRLTFGAGIVVPAVAAFVALRFAPSALAPLGHAMRGDSPMASGVLAVLTLMGAAALAARSLGSSRSAGTLVATVGALLLGIAMIIVTFSASETAELEIPPGAGGIVPFLAPIIPLGLGLAAFAKARQLWLSRYERSDAIKLVALTSFMLFALLELGPLGAVRAAAPSVSGTVKPAAPARPAP